MRRDILAALLMMAALPPAEAEPEEPVRIPDGETFHGHLDKCWTCRERPMTGMCRLGAALLKREGEAIAKRGPMGGGA